MGNLNITYLKTKTGKTTVEVDGYLLHSKYDPVNESRKIIETKYEKQKLTIIFGLGLGYLLDEIKKRKENLNNIILIDPLYKKLKHIEQNDVHVLDHINLKEIEKVIGDRATYFDRKFNVICSPNYDKLFMEEYKIVLESIRNVQKMNLVAENTLRFYSEDWQRNSIYNLASLQNSYNLCSLKKKFDCPVIIASGGPSLIKQLPLLKKNARNIIVIAAGSTVNTLINNDIIPDFVVSIDGTIENYKHFKNLDSQNINLIYGFSSYYKIQQKSYKNKYAFLDFRDRFFSEYLKTVYDIDLPLIIGGSSVAIFALSIALYITTGPIALIGQDLAYTNFKTHAEGNEGFKLVDEDYKQERGLFETQGYFDDKVLTDYAFILMKKDFETLYQETDEKNLIYNCTEGGVKIEFMPQLAFQDFVDKYIQADEIKVKLNSPSIYIENFEWKLKEELSIYDRLIKQLKVALLILKRNKSTTNFDKNVLKELDKTDKMILKLKEQTAMQQIFNPITLDILSKYKENDNETKKEKFNRLYDQNKELYSRLLEAVTISKKYVNNLLENLENEEC